MQIVPDDEFLAICREIAMTDHGEDEWAEIESDDMFQTDSYTGGYDATEEAFTFSYYAPDGEEYWFQLTLAEVKALAAGQQVAIEGRPAGS
jgi:hypothetical protein